MSDSKELMMQNEVIAQTNNFVIPITNPVPLTGNAKRKAACQKIGGEKKRVGHVREDHFKAQFNPGSLNEKTEYAATSDTWLEASADITQKLAEKFGFETRDLYVSNKSGNNIQLTLGRIPELESDSALDWIKTSTNCTELFNKYLKKSDSQRPADLLVYKDLPNGKWIFFKMSDIVNYITDNVKWRKLKSGRIKGDFEDSSRKGVSQYVTYEFRSTHNSHFLGMNGNKGLPFIKLMREKVAFYEVDIVEKE